MYRLPGFPLHFASGALQARWQFPVLGDGTAAVFGELLGYSADQIADLVREGALA